MKTAMKIFYHFLFVSIINFCNLRANANSINLSKIIEIENFYQTVQFVSSNYTGKTSELDRPSIHENPTITYSFYENRPTILNWYFKDPYKSEYAIHGSLIIFHTSDLNEIEPFMDFIEGELTIRNSPKCLIAYGSSYSFTVYDEIHIVKALKLAWLHTFLDFTVIVTDIKIEFFYFNPFNDVVYRKELAEKTNKMFPDRLANAYGFPVNTSAEYVHNGDIIYIRRPNEKVKVDIDPHYVLKFTGRILNFDIAFKNISSESAIFPGFLSKWDLDFYGSSVSSGDYADNFFISSDEAHTKLVAFVPIIINSQTGSFFKMFFNVVMIFGIFSIFLLAFSHFKTTLGSIEVFDFVRIFFGQSISREPQKTLHRIILLTIIVVTVKITNDFLLDAFTVQFDKEEVPFETYKDLHDSGLQTYTNMSWLKRFVYFGDRYLLKVVKKTTIVDEIRDCFNTLKVWKNVSCIAPTGVTDVKIENNRDSDGSPTMKIAQPPILFEPLGFYWFAEGSPYAMKFLEIMRRIKETDLMHWPALVYKNPTILTFAEVERIKLDDGIDNEQLLTILMFGYFVSIVAFISEWVVFKVGRVNMSISLVNWVKFKF